MSVLSVRSLGDPRQHRLEELAKARVAAPDALLLLGAAHAGEKQADFRRHMAGAGERVFVHPSEVPGLTAALLTRLIDNLNAAESVRDDLLTAGFAAYGVMAIHPFSNGNGRTAADFAQYLLMVRWGRPTSPLAPPSDLHRILARIYAALDPKTEPTAASLIAERDRMLEVITRADLAFLRQDHAFNCAADVLAACASGQS